MKTSRLKELVADYQRVYLKRVEAETEADAAKAAADAAAASADAIRRIEIDLSDTEQVALSVLLAYIEDFA